MTVKTIARKIGLNPSSNGQLMKTDLEAGGLRLGGFATRPLGVAPKALTDRLGQRRAPARHWGDLDSVIDYGAIGLRSPSRASLLFRRRRHIPYMRF
ncbi:hypothetical protein OK349_03865 [Sphingomonas sp. BT-65]|uniref:hypothetical protein n=1 Tax=Sphingomonas sp. BT-65 TaxID=2989821 RepID=UPI0022354A33|nr:hypothetical protein [Sphingomonas sp. BT-65]MCW4460830.1 hypothetical protein [Sphingomonas sp. BT-65]